METNLAQEERALLLSRHQRRPREKSPREESRWTATEHKASTLRESQVNVQCNSVLHCLTYSKVLNIPHHNPLRAKGRSLSKPWLPKNEPDSRHSQRPLTRSTPTPLKISRPSFRPG